MCVFISHRKTPTRIPQPSIGNMCMSPESQFAFWGGNLCARETQENRVEIETNTSAGHSFKKNPTKQNKSSFKGGLSPRLIYAN